MSLYRLEYSTDGGNTWEDSGLIPMTNERVHIAKPYWTAGFLKHSPTVETRIVNHETDAEKLARYQLVRYQRALEDIARKPYTSVQASDRAFNALKGE